MGDSFGTLLRERRRIAGRNQSWLAVQVGLDVSYISKLENDRLPAPAADTIVALCQALQCDNAAMLAVSGKLPTTVQQVVATSPEAQTFLMEAEQQKLSDADWAVMRAALQKLRCAKGEAPADAATTTPLATAAVHPDIARRREDSEHRITAQALRESEERYRAFIAHSSEGVMRFESERPIPIDLSVDEQLDMIYKHGFLAECNDKLAQMYGYSSAEEVTGVRLDAILPCSEPHNVAYLREFIQSDYQVSGALSQVRDAAGNRRYFDNNLIGIVENGMLLRSWGTRRDTTTSKIAQDALRASEELFRQAFDHAGVGMLLAAIDGPILRANKELSELIGYSIAELVTMKFTDFTHPDDHDSDQEWQRQLLAGEINSHHTEKRYIHKTGRMVWVYRSVSLVRDHKGVPLNYIGQIQDISGRKQAEAALSDSEERLRAQYKGIPVPTYTWRRVEDDFVLTDYNDAAMTISEGRIAEQVGIAATEFHKDSPEILADLANCFAEHTTIKRELTYTFRTVKKTRHLATNYVFVPPDLIMLHVEDITARKMAEDELLQRRADLELRVAQRTAELSQSNSRLEQELTERLRTQEALRVSEEKFRAIFEHAPVMISSYTADRRCVLWNAECERQLGYTQEEVADAGDSLQLFYPDEEHRATVIDLLARRDSRFSEHLVRAADGTDRHQMWASFQLPNSDVISLGYDITESKKAEALLQASEARYRAIVEDQTELICRYLQDGTRTFVNEAYCRDIGKTRDELLGTSFMASMSSEERLEMEQYLASFSLDMPTAQMDQQIVSADGRMQRFHWTDHALFDEQGNVVEFQSVGSDVTERELAKEAAEEANRAKSEFLSRMSHELRTPLNAILGFAELLEMGDLAPADRESVEFILPAGRHLLGLINEVLDISAIESGKMALSPEAVSVAETLATCVGLVRPLAAGRTISIDLNFAVATDCCVLADRQRLAQVLLNLLANAVKYNHNGGNVQINCAEAAGRRLLITVRDTGPGIESHKLARLFTPFDRLGAENSTIEGTGLGLALSQRLIEAMGGTIGADSQFGVGSTFWIELPLAESPEDKAARIDRDIAAAVAVSAPTRSVLYIEDNISNLRLVEGILKRYQDISIIPAMQGRIGIDLARAHQPDIILLDLNLPDIGGEVVLRLLQSDPLTRSIPVLVISADATPEQTARLLNAGAHAYITKPLQVKHFLGAVRQALALSDECSQHIVAPEDG